MRLVSHEIRTPLNVVFTGLNVIKKELLKRENEDELLDTVTDSETSCETAIELLNDLLSYEKLEAGLMTLNKTAFAATGFIQDSMKAFRIQVNIHQIYIPLLT